MYFNKDTDFDSSVHSDFPQEDYSWFMDLLCTEIFEQLVDNEIITFLINENKRHALFKNCLDPKISMDEMKCFIGILLLTGYNSFPTRQNY